MQAPDGSYWTSDEALFASLPGAAEVIQWFGFIPSFHDAMLDRFEMADGTVTMRLKAFRMTDQVDASGYFICDRPALVTFRLSAVTGIRLQGNAVATVLELALRRVDQGQPDWTTCDGPAPGDIQLAFESAYGLEGSIYAREVALRLDPLQA